MHRKNVTISEVARRADVSKSTVSRVLSGAETAISISQETRQRVLAAAEELSYQPNPLARALKGKGVNLLGLIVREIDDPFFAQLIEVIGNVAKEEGYDLVLGYAKSDPEEALALREVLDLRHTDGLFLLGDLKETPEDYTFLAKMVQDHRMISLCRGSGQIVGNTPFVSIDNRKGVFMALDYLAQLGHRRIAFITSNRLGDLHERMDAYCEFMSDRLGEFCQEYIQFGENSYGGGDEATRSLLSLPSPPSAIFAVDDTMAIGALSAAWDLGLVVARDVSIVGFDDIKICAYLQPPLTTVRQPIEKIGKKAVELLLEMIREEVMPDPLPQFLMEPELVVRGSCGPPRRQQIT